jgi:dGTPase
LNNFQSLNDLKNELDREEENRLSQWACPSMKAVRQRKEKQVEIGHRQNFFLDTDRILHSLAYSRYIDKTQVFYLINNDHITHRVLHVQLVSKISRTIGRLLRMNEDLIEAIALGHDIGHTPFGHEGESFLSALSKKYGLNNFLHNVQSVRALDKLEKKGTGWNLTLQVLDGILCHDGELHSQALYPDTDKDFTALFQEMKKKQEDPQTDILPMTIEGCAVRMADTISYIGRDIEDAIRLRFIKRSDLPEDCRKILGETNGTIVYTLVEDLVANSLNKPYVCFSDEVGKALKSLKTFNQEKIYARDLPWKQTEKIELMFELLFEKHFQELQKGDEVSEIYKEFLDGMSDNYRNSTSDAETVRDFIAGMTDEYFIEQCHRHLVPHITPTRF